MKFSNQVNQLLIDGFSMNNSKVLCLYVSISLFVIIAHGECAIAQEGDNVLSVEVRDRLQKSATSVSRMFVKFEQTKSGSALGNYWGPSTFSVNFDSGRFLSLRKDTVREKDGRITTSFHEDSFDGKYFYFGTPKIEAGDIPAVVVKYLVSDSTDPKWRSHLIDIPYMGYAGFHVAQTIADLNTTLIESLVLRSMRESVKTSIEKVDNRILVTTEIPDTAIIAMKGLDIEQERKNLESGKNSPEYIAQELQVIREIQSLEPRRVVKFLLDSRYNWGVVEREDYTLDGKLIVKVTASDWQFYDKADMWMPSHVTAVYYTYPSAPVKFTKDPLTTFSIHVKEINFAPPSDVAFQLDYRKPGSLVRDRSSPEARARTDREMSFRVSADGRTLQQSGREAPMEGKK